MSARRGPRILVKRAGHDIERLEDHFANEVGALLAGDSLNDPSEQDGFGVLIVKHGARREKLRCLSQVIHERFPGQPLRCGFENIRATITARMRQKMRHVYGLPGQGAAQLVEVVADGDIQPKCAALCQLESDYGQQELGGAAQMKARIVSLTLRATGNTRSGTRISAPAGNADGGYDAWNSGLTLYM